MPRTLLYILLPLLIAGAFLGAYFAFRPAPPKPAPEQPNPPAPPAPAAAADDNQPKLVVLVVFDQMRGDYPTRWADLYGPDGFNRFKKEGIWFSECHIPYACTSTGPGHASIATGAAPRTHGIIENAWYDRTSGKTTYCCEPLRPYELVPPVPKELGKPGRGAANGFSPERLLAQTVADSLIEETKGKGRVFSLSIKDRTAVLMGGRKPSGAYCFDVRDGKFHTSAYYGRDAAHAWVIEFNGANPANAWFEKKWEKFKPELDYAKFSSADDVPAESPGVNGQGRTFPHPFKGELTEPAAPYFAAVELSPAGNELLFALAKKAITAEKLGRASAPDLLCLSFSSNDLVGHFYGPDSQEILDITLRSDQLIAELLAFLDAEVGKGRYVMVITADHGVCPIPELPGTKAKYPAAQRRSVNELAEGLNKYLDAIHGGGPTQWLEAFDGDTWPWVHLNHKAIEARKLNVETVAVEARDWFTGRGFIETAFTRAELDAKDLKEPPPFKLPAMLAYHPDRSGDVIVIPKAGVLITPYATGTSHGSPQPYDTHVPFLVYGANVPALGERKEKVSSLAVAPTLAWALGVPSPRNAAVLRPEALPARKQ